MAQSAVHTRRSIVLSTREPRSTPKCSHEGSSDRAAAADSVPRAVPRLLDLGWTSWDPIQARLAQRCRRGSLPPAREQNPADRVRHWRQAPRPW